MSTWRRRAIECAPELKKEFEQGDLTPYTVFSELLPITIQAHKDNDHNRLNKIYDFAEWCFRQKNEKLWNAAGVCFYEHLGDADESFQQFHNWVKKEIYIDIRDLLNRRLDDNKMKLLDDYYKIITKRRG